METTQNKWLRNVNPDWKIVPSYLLFSDRQQQCLPEDEHLTPSQKYGVVRQSDFMETTGNRVVLNLSGADKMKHVEPGDFVIHLRSFQGGIEYSTLRGKVSNAYTVLSPSEDVHHDFFRWFMKSDLLISGLETLTDQLRDGQTINFARFSRLSFPLPPLDTQRAIADYLDRETSEIDAMLDKLDGLGRLLEERRRTEVEHAFVEGEYPTAALSLVANSLPGFAFPSDNFAKDGPGDMLLRGVNVKPATLDWDDSVRLVSPMPETGIYRLRTGDVVLGLDRPYIGSGLRCARLQPSDGSPLLVQRVLRVRDSAGLLSSYFYYLVQRQSFYDHLAPSFTGISVPHISESQVLSYTAPLPPLDEQERIVQHLDETTARIDAMLAKTQQLKDLLTERRSALITAAVTGQIEVH